MLKLKNKERREEKNNAGTELFSDFTTLEAQMQSLKTKGFLRSYKSYSPPSNLKELFMSSCSSSLGRKVSENTLQTEVLDSIEVKFKVLSALSEVINHSVHNSRLSEIKTLADALLYYQVNTKYRFIIQGVYFVPRTFLMNLADRLQTFLKGDDLIWSSGICFKV